MNTIKQVVFREEDDVFMIVPNEVEVPVIPRYIYDLTVDQQATFQALKDFCLTQVDTLEYTVYTSESNTLDMQPISGTTVSLIVSEMSIDDKALVDNVGDICTLLINS